jgi:hypothetical protein
LPSDFLSLGGGVFEVSFGDEDIIPPPGKASREGEDFGAEEEAGAEAIGAGTPPTERLVVNVVNDADDRDRERGGDRDELSAAEGETDIQKLGETLEEGWGATGLGENVISCVVVDSTEVSTGDGATTELPTTDAGGGGAGALLCDTVTDAFVVHVVDIDVAMVACVDEIDLVEESEAALLATLVSATSG